MNEIHEREVKELLKKLTSEKKLEAQTLKQRAGNKSEYERRASKLHQHNFIEFEIISHRNLLISD